jgi:hypothetical protein
VLVAVVSPTGWAHLQCAVLPATARGAALKGRKSDGAQMRTLMKTLMGLGLLVIILVLMAKVGSLPLAPSSFPSTKPSPPPPPLIAPHTGFEVPRPSAGETELQREMRYLRACTNPRTEANRLLLANCIKIVRDAGTPVTRIRPKNSGGMVHCGVQDGQARADGHWWARERRYALRRERLRACATSVLLVATHRRGGPADSW